MCHIFDHPRSTRFRSWSGDCRGPPSNVSQPPHTSQQNGHASVGGRGLDAEAKERLKLRREEVQRKKMERKQVAARKLQKLEQKIKIKKAKTEDRGLHRSRTIMRISIHWLQSTANRAGVLGRSGAGVFAEAVGW